jgi:outer membrane protein
MVRLLPMLAAHMRFLDRRRNHILPGPVVRLTVLLGAAVTLMTRAGSVYGSDATPTPPSRPLALADAEARALEHQPAIAQAHGLTEAAEGRVEQARAGYLPQVTATGIYERTTGNFAPRPGSLPTTTTSASWNGNTYNYFSFGATGSQLIYDFGQTDGRWRAAGANRDASKVAEQTTRAQTLLNVRRAYFQARAGKDLTVVAGESVRNQQKHLDQIQAFVGAGMRPAIDLAQARTDLANARVQLVTANNNYDLALVALDQAMGIPADVRFEPTETELAPVAGEAGAPDRLVADAERARPDVATLEEQRRAQTLTVRALEGGYGPAFNAIAAATDTGTEIDHLVPNWYLGLSLNWPILQGGLTRGQVREANGTLTALAAQLESLRLQIRADVEQARLAVAAAKSTISAAEEALVNAREQLRLAERRYETGLGSAIELGDAQVASTSAAAQEVGARTNLALARALLLNALGTP